MLFKSVFGIAIMLVFLKMCAMSMSFMPDGQSTNTTGGQGTPPPTTMVPQFTNVHAISLAQAFLQNLPQPSQVPAPGGPGGLDSEATVITITPDGAFNSAGNPLPPGDPNLDLPNQAQAQPATQVSDDSPTSDYALPQDPSNYNETYFLPRWKVGLPGKAEVDVVDGTGIVPRFSNTAYFRRPPSKQPVSSLMTSNAAISLARTTLQAMGQGEGELAEPTTHLCQDNDGLLQGESHWEITWVRQFNGIPYLNQIATVSLDAETGEIISAQLNFPTAAPSQGEVLISSAAAQAIAITQLSQASQQPDLVAPIDPNVSASDWRLAHRQDWTNLPSTAVFSSAQTLVVEPNAFWQTGEQTTIQSTSRAAWKLIYLLGNGQDDDYFCSVYVDAQTGAVIGGEYSGGARHASLSVRPIQPKATSTTPKKTAKYSKHKANKQRKNN